ncbi:MAG: hypothetical protein ACLRSA_01070 [Streptococcus salivarius]
MNRKQALLLYLSGTPWADFTGSVSFVLAAKSSYEKLGLIMGLQLASLPLC